MQKGCWQRRATFPGALKDCMGLWSENTLAGDRRMDKMASEIQPGPWGWSTPWPASVTALLPTIWLLSRFQLLSALLLCPEGFDFLSICGVFAKKGNSVHTLRVGVTDSHSGKAPSSWSHQVSSSFWLIILPKKPILHHAEAVKTQVVFSLLGLCWVVRDTSWKTRLLMHRFPRALCLAFAIHGVSPWENVWASARRKVQGKWGEKRQELDENRQKACRNNK